MSDLQSSVGSSNESLSEVLDTSVHELRTTPTNTSLKIPGAITAFPRLNADGNGLGIPSETGTFVFSDTPEVTGSLAGSGNNEDGGDSNSQTKPGGNEESPIDEDECKDQTAEETTTISSTNKNGKPHSQSKLLYGLVWMLRNIKLFL